MNYFYENAHYIVFIGSVLVVLGTVLASLQQANWQNRIAAKNLEIAELNRQIANTVTGGDSYARLGLVLDKGNFGLVHLVVQQRGTYPVYDIQVYLRNMTQQADMTQAGVKEGKVYHSVEGILKATEWTIDVGNLGPGRYRALGKFRLPDNREEQDFEASVTSRNDSREYEFWFRLINKKWVYGIRIKQGDKIIESKIDPSIPLDERQEPKGTALISRPWPVPLPD